MRHPLSIKKPEEIGNWRCILNKVHTYPDLLLIALTRMQTAWNTVYIIFVATTTQDLLLQSRSHGPLRRRSIWKRMFVSALAPRWIQPGELLLEWAYSIHLRKYPVYLSFRWWIVFTKSLWWPSHSDTRSMFNPYPTAFPYGNDMVLHFYQQQESSTTKTVHKVINKGLKTYV